MKKSIFKSHRFWAIALAFVLVVAMSLTMIGTSAYAANAAGNPAYEGSRFTATTGSAAEALDKSNEVNVKIAEEGSVLLKNNGALPLGAAPKISVFGKNTNFAVHGGSGSSGGSGAGQVDIYAGLDNAGIDYNPALKAFYADNTASGAGRPASPGMGEYPTGFATGETPVASYDATLKTTFADYDDAAVVMISRIGGEGYDLPRTSLNTAGRSDASQHYLELDDNETALIEMVKENFDNVVIVLNTAQVIELGDLTRDEEIDSILWIGLPGGTGFNALGSILTGEVNPSGKTVNTYMADFFADPAVQNFAFNDIGSTAGRTNPAGNEYRLANNTGTGYFEVTYEEGIYIGYRYYETRGFVEGEEWYNENVVYPFGYGLSYTSFDWDVSFPDEGVLTKDGKLTVYVTVTNTGDVAGRDVVELYYSAPYKNGGIEKSHVVLGGFAKTELIDPDGSDIVEITIDVEEMASYDYNDANDNGYKTYELDAGNYTLYVGTDAHTAWTDGESAVYTVPEGGFQYEMDIDGDGDKNDNQFDDVSAGVTGDGIDLMSRTDFAGTFPTTPTAAELTVSASFGDNMPETVTASYDAGQPWFVAEADMPSYRTTALTSSDTNIIRLSALAGKDYDDALWDDFMDQFTIAQLASMINNGAYMTNAIAVLGIPASTLPDGPTGYAGAFGAGYIGAFFVCPTVMAATWNTDLMSELGEAWGDEGIWNGVNGIYAPAANIHRTPFSGRNFEYYSEDGFLSGAICAPVVEGLQSRGVVAFVKHFALNDQESNRTTKSILTWADEQTIREIYLKAFQSSFEDAGAKGAMSAFNRLGFTWAGASYALLTNVLRKEWGFTGAVITDFGGQDTYMNVDQMIRAGNDFYLWWESFASGYQRVTTTAAALTATHVTAMRTAAKNVCYMVLSSNGMNLLETYAANVDTTDLTVYASLKSYLSIRSTLFASEFSGLTYELAEDSAALPAGLVFNESGSISGVCTAEDGAYPVKITLKTADGYLAQTATFTINVTADTSGADTALIDIVYDLGMVIDSLAGDLVALESQNDALSSDIAAVKAKLTEANIALAAAQGKINSLEDALKATEDALKAAEDALKEAEKAIADNKTAGEAKDKELADKIDALKAEIDALKSSDEGGCGAVIAGGSIFAGLAIIGLVTVLILAKKRKTEN